MSVRQMVELRRQGPDAHQLRGYAAQAHAIRTFDRRHELARVRTPTLVLVGAEDVLTPPSQSVDMARRIPGAELVICPAAATACSMEFPGPTLQAIEAFLSTTAQSAG